MLYSSIGSRVLTEFLFIINHQFCKYIIEGTCIHTIIQLGLNP